MSQITRMQVAGITVPLLGFVCLLPWIDGGVALLLGMVTVLTIGNPYADKTQGLSKRLLSLSVVGLGAGMNLMSVAKAGMAGLGYAALSISLIMAAGILLGRLLKTEKESSILLTVGTAICGGSAIAAIAPVINAKPHNISVSIAVVFVLNALALFLFPAIGHHLDLSQEQFGLWSALAIHDTSSVVGASAQYGDKALEIGTAVKLARALWIVPLVFLVQWAYHRNGGEAEEGGAKPKRKYPWFIMGFLAMAALVTFVPALEKPGEFIEWVARRTLVLTLFLIGTNLTRQTLAAVGAKPLLQGVILWLLVIAASLTALKTGLL